MARKPEGNILHTVADTCQNPEKHCLIAKHGDCTQNNQATPMHHGPLLCDISLSHLRSEKHLFGTHTWGISGSKWCSFLGMFKLEWFVNSEAYIMIIQCLFLESWQWSLPQGKLASLKHTHTVRPWEDMGWVSVQISHFCRSQPRVVNTFSMDAYKAIAEKEENIWVFCKLSKEQISWRAGSPWRIRFHWTKWHCLVYKHVHSSIICFSAWLWQTQV